MKKIMSLFLLMAVMSGSSAAFALDTEIKAPVWDEYVAPKYQIPRDDFSKGGAIAETAIGELLIGLIITAPIGIPLAVHGITKIKMISYANRKKIFDELITEANTIENDAERAQAYQNALKKAHLKEKTRQHYMKKAAKAEAKSDKRAAKAEAKAAKKLKAKN